MDKPFQSVYLIKEREFLKTKENVIKIGKTKQSLNKRINQYPKGSELLLQITTDDCDNLENAIIKAFKDKYIHRKDIGNEYFEGDHEDMIETICFLRKNFIKINNEEKIEIERKIKNIKKLKEEKDKLKEEEKKNKELIKEEKIIQKEVNNTIELIIGEVEKKNKELIKEEKIIQKEVNNIIELIIGEVEKKIINTEKNKIEKQRDGKKQKENKMELFIIKTFINNFIITNNKLDYILSSEIQSWISTNELDIHIAKLSVHIKNYCKKNNFDKVINCNKRIPKLGVKTVWLGISKIN